MTFAGRDGRSVRSILSSAFLALLGGCASGEWVKTSGELAGEPVLAQCSQQAWARAHQAQMSSPSSVPAQVVQQDKAGRSTTTYDSVRVPQADVQEQTFFNLCMKELGYDYVPVTPGSFH